MVENWVLWYLIYRGVDINHRKQDQRDIRKSEPRESIKVSQAQTESLG